MKAQRRIIDEITTALRQLNKGNPVKILIRIAPIRGYFCLNKSPIATNTLGKNERLKSRKLITELFKSGKAFNVFPFRIVYAAPGDSPPLGGTPFFKGGEHTLKAGFSVSTRNFKKAVERNRIKRLMRESYRTQKSELAEILQKQGKKLVFFFIFTGKELPEHDFIEIKMKMALEKLIKIVDETVA